MLLVIQPHHLLRMAMLRQPDQPHFAGGGAPGDFDEPVGRWLRSREDAREAGGPLHPAPMTPTTLDLRAQRGKVCRHASRAAQPQFLATIVQHRHRRFGRKPLGVAVQIAIHHQVADQNNLALGKPVNDLN